MCSTKTKINTYCNRDNTTNKKYFFLSTSMKLYKSKITCFLDFLRARHFLFLHTPPTQPSGVQHQLSQGLDDQTFMASAAVHTAAALCS